jgi:hypothetical protein
MGEFETGETAELPEGSAASLRWTDAPSGNPSLRQF